MKNGNDRKRPCYSQECRQHGTQWHRVITGAEYHYQCCRRCGKTTLVVPPPHLSRAADPHRQSA
jgi:hypothetical protein